MWLTFRLRYIFVRWKTCHRSQLRMHFFEKFQIRFCNFFFLYCRNREMDYWTKDCTFWLAFYKHLFRIYEPRILCGLSVDAQNYTSLQKLCWEGLWHFCWYRKLTLSYVNFQYLNFIELQFSIRYIIAMVKKIHFWIFSLINSTYCIRE